MNHLIADRYLLEAELARGAAGIVHRAVDQESGDRVAVKVMHADSVERPDMTAAFLDEAEVLSHLDHPGIVRPRNLIADGETFALVMDLVEGRDMRRVLAEDGPYSPSRAAVLVAQVCEALAAVHAAGVVHGDVKPGNVLLDEPNGGPKLVDFGVARRVTVSQEQTRGTPDYTPPEVVRGYASSAKSDMYGVGLVLYEAMCAVNPYRGGGVEEVLDRQCQMIPQRPQQVPPELWAVVDACLSADPNQRPDAAAAAAQLRTLADGVSAEPGAALLGTPPMQPRQAPAMTPSDGGYANPAGAASTASPVTGPPTTVAPAVLVPGMNNDEDTHESGERTSKTGLWIGAAAGFVALVAVCVLWFATTSTQSPPQVQGDEKSSQESEAPADDSQTLPEESDSPSPSQTPSTDGEDSKSSRDSNEDGGARDNPGDGSDSSESESDLPGDGPIGSPLPGRAGSN